MVEKLSVNHNSFIFISLPIGFVRPCEAVVSDTQVVGSFGTMVGDAGQLHAHMN